MSEIRVDGGTCREAIPRTEGYQGEDKKVNLMYAVKHRHEGHIKACLVVGISPNLVMDNGCPMLHFAIESGWLKIVEMLLQYGADVNMTNGDSATALHIAARHGNIPILKLLLQKDARSINHRDRKGNTPLHLAAKKGYFHVAALLMQYGGDPQYYNKNFKQPAHFALESRYFALVELLTGATTRLNQSNPLSPATNGMGTPQVNIVQSPILSYCSPRSKL